MDRHLHVQGATAIRPFAIRIIANSTVANLYPTLKVRQPDSTIRHSNLARHPPGRICRHSRCATISLSPQPSSRQATLHCSTSTMPRKSTSGPTPKKHTFLPFKDKLVLIRKCEAGMAHSAVAAEMGVPRSTVSTIWKNRDKYHQAAASTSSTTSLVLRGSRDSRLDTMEDMLIKWIEDRAQHKMLISMGLVQECALSLWEDLQTTTSTTNNNEMDSFMNLLDGTTPRTVLRSTLKHLDPVPTPMVLRNHGKRKRSQTRQRAESSKQPKHGGGSESLNFSGAPDQNESLHLSHSLGPNQTYANITSTQEQDSVSDGSINLEDAGRFRRKKNPIMFSSVNADLNMSKGIGSEDIALESGTANSSRRLGDITYGNITSSQDQSISDGSINTEDATKFKKKKAPIAFSSIETDLNISGITTSQELESSEGSSDIESIGKLRRMRTRRTLLSTKTGLSDSNVTLSQGTQPDEADDSDTGLKKGMQPEAAPHTSHIKELDQTYGNISASQDASTVSDESVSVGYVEKFKKKRDRIAFTSVDVDLGVSNLASQKVESESSEEGRIGTQLSKDQSLNINRADHEDFSYVADNVMDISPVSPPKSRTEAEKSPKKAYSSSQALSSVNKHSPYEEVSKRRLEVSLVDVINESPKKGQSLGGLMDKALHGLELSHEHLQNLTQELLQKEKEGARQRSFHSGKPLSPSVSEELNQEQGSQADKPSKEESVPNTWDSQDSSGTETKDIEKTRSKNLENDVDIADDDEVISSTSDEDNVLDGETVIGLVSSSQNKKLAEMEIKLIPETQESPVFQPGFEGAQILAVPNTRDSVHQQRFEASQNMVVSDIQELQRVPAVVLEPQDTPMAVPAPLAGSVAPEAQPGPSVVPEPQPELLDASEPHERSGATPGTHKPVAIPGIQEGSVVPEVVEGHLDNLESLEVEDDSIPPPLGFRDADTKGGPPAILDVKTAITNSDLLESIISDFNTVADENGTGFEEEEKQKNEENRADSLDSLPFRVMEFDTGNSGMEEEIGKSIDNLAHGGIRPVGEAISSSKSEKEPLNDKVQSKEVVDTVSFGNYGTVATDATNLISSDKVMPMNHDTLCTVTPQKNLAASPVGTPGGTDNQSPKSRSLKKRPKHKPWSPKKKTPKEETPIQTLPKRGKRGEADMSDSISPQEAPSMETPQKSGKGNSSNITMPQRGSSKEKITPKSATPQRGRPRKETTPRTTLTQKPKPSKQTAHISPSPKAGNHRRERMSGSESFHRRAGSRNTVFTKRHLVIEAEVHAPPDLVEDDGSSLSQKTYKEGSLVSPTPAASEFPQVMESESTENMTMKVETPESTSTNIRVVPDTQTMEEADSTVTQGQAQQDSPVIASEASIDNVLKYIDMKLRETERVKVIESNEEILNQAESEAEPSHSKKPEPNDIEVVHDVVSAQIKSDIINKENVEPNLSMGNVVESSDLTNDDNLLGVLSYGLNKQVSDRNHVELNCISEKSQPKDVNKSGSQSVLRRPDASAESLSSGRTSEEKNLKQLTMREFLKNLAKASHAPLRHVPTVQDLMRSSHTNQEHVFRLPKATQKVKKDPQKTLSASKTKEVLNHFARGYIKKETVDAAMEVSEQFFANMFFDLEALVSIRNRKTVSMKDMESLMRRFSLITTNASLYALMQDHLPVDVWSTVIPVAYASNKIIPEPM
ncbi:uncharacterized protein LOC143038238 isoform X3 [Oratosquilla oratoria]|uniref:uncharacterized protein LOC143038238 isoform X3 n=1 Tax=Oratosquilla oratoria TaxID=337810 RepID=UPI003F766505